MNTKVISVKEISHLRWLANEARISDLLFGHVLFSVRINRPVYKVVNIPKCGGSRRLTIPDPSLMKVQRAISRNVLSQFSVHEKAFGFSGGGIVDAISPHLQSKVMLSFDIVDAFRQVDYPSVMNCLTEGRHEDYWEGIQNYGEISWYAARAISQISTIKYKVGIGIFYKSCLPQGAPTSPRLFDLALKENDTKWSRLADIWNGVYTRYADNIFFSLKEKTYFPPKMERAVLRASMYPWHKRRVRRLDKGVLRMLGLNIIDGKITVTRDYKRNLRLAIHHIRYLIDHDLPFEDAWLRLKGQMAHAFNGFLPDRLVIKYEYLREEVEYLLGY